MPRSNMLILFNSNICVRETFLTQHLFFALGDTMKTPLLKILPFLIMTTFLMTGCNQKISATATAAKPTVTTQELEPTGPVYKGTVLGKSIKAKQISIAIGKGEAAKIITVSFDELTKGIEHAARGYKATIIYEMRDGVPFATVIKSKLARLPQGVTIISPADMHTLIKGNSDFLLIDSRPAKRYSASHLPGAISLPVCETQELLQNLPKDKDKLLIFYCGGPTCGMSPKSAGQADKAGYKNIRIMLAGESAWIKAGFPTYADYGFVCRGNNVIVDLRSKEKDASSRIPRSVNMPFSEFTDYYNEIPVKAPVILYSDNSEETMSALRILRTSGYKKISLVEGGFRGWTGVEGNLLTEGPVVTDVRWHRILAEGEVSVAEFKKALQDPTAAVILDVRTDDEVKEGKFAGSQHIPLERLRKEIDHFNSSIKGMMKGKKIYIHCTTGARAEMAYKELKKHDFNAYYLVAKVKCEGSDCSIEE